MLRNMIEHVLFTEIGRIPAKHFTKKSKWSLRSAKNMKLQTNSFFATIDKILKALLMFLSTKFSISLKKKQKDTSVTNRW